MKKKMIFIVLILTLFASRGVNATAFHTRLPGGKNYLYSENFTLNGNRLIIDNDILVKSSETYTLSFPGEGLLEFPEVYLYSNSEVYVDGLASDFTDCDVDLGTTSCTFTINPLDEYLHIEIESVGLGTFINYYGFTDIQLEEGSIATEYEEYILPMVDSNSPEFSGNAAFIMAYYDYYTVQQIIDSHILAIDDIDGDITDDIVIVSDDYSANQHIVGEYLVVLEVSDAAGNTTSFNLTIIVKDEIKPTITGPFNLDINIDENLTIGEIIAANYTATDGYYGALTVTAKTDNYTVNKDTVGSYSVVLQAIDGSNNVINENVWIHVKDYTAPVYNGSNSIDVNMSNPQNITEIINSLDFVDNYYQKEDIIVTLIRDEYSANSNDIGTYDIELTVEDPDGNAALEIININIIDDITPVITGPQSYSFSYTDPHSLNQLISLFDLSDNYDTLTTDNLVILSDSYSSRTTETGLFIIVFELEDLSGNKVEHTMNVTIVDDVAPIIYIDNYLVTVTENASFKKEDAIRMLVNNHELPDEEYEVEVVKDEYLGNENTPGTYQYTLKITDERGVSYQKDFIIRVPEEEVSELNDNYLFRNIITYTLSIGFLGYVIYKTKK